jgi:hypothetical protein
MILTGEAEVKTEVLGEKFVRVPLCALQISYELTLGSNTGLRGGRPATDRQSHGTAMLGKCV